MKAEIERHQVDFKDGMRSEIKDLDFSFDTIYNKLYRSSFRYGIYLLNDEFIIENIVQDAFLKLWNFRETITSLEHASRFLKQTVRWECYNYFRTPAGRFSRRSVSLEEISDHNTEISYFEPEEQVDITDYRLKMINSTVGFLPSEKDRNWLMLHYYDGLSHKEIASRYNVSVTEVVLTLVKTIGKLKAMIVRPNVFTAESEEEFRPISIRFNIHNMEILNTEQSSIYQLRLQGKYEFKQIAEHLKLSQAHVQQQYVQAWKKMNASKSNKVSHRSCYKPQVPLSA